MFDGISQVHVVADCHHDAALIVIDRAKLGVIPVILIGPSGFHELQARHLKTVIQVPEGMEDGIVPRNINDWTVGKYAAVVPTLGGQAWITGMATYVVDPDDPFPEGFTIGDIW